MSNAAVYVIDASTTLKWIFEDEVDSEPALAVLKAYLSGKIQLLAPNLWVYEVANATRTAVLRKRLAVKTAQEKLKHLLRAAPKLVSVEEEIELCLKNAFVQQISVYDAVYLTLAQANKTTLISADKKLVKQIAKPKLVMDLKDFP